ncbi:hypothetical protein OIV83_005714 [Microbotryomycetes sp. JL201]|nr:hypothetical protein OIV83_005714 [Microbotryomycetes sp. JL201]
MAHITVLYFASVREALPGEPALEVVALPRTPFPLSQLKQHLMDHVHPNNPEFSAALAKSAWSVDEAMVDDDTAVELNSGQVVCPIPPVSGG